MAVLQEISEQLQRGKAKLVKELVQQAIDEGIPAKEILEEGLLSGMGVIGTALAGGMMWLMGRGLLRGVKTHPDRAQLCMLAVACVLVATLGTVFYSRDIMAVAALGALVILQKK